METLQQVIPALGLFGLLACAALLLVRIATVYVSGRVHRIRASAELIGLLVVLDFTIGPGLRFLGADSLVASVERAVLAATAIGVAFLLNGVVRVVLWDGLLSDHGQRKVPVIVTGSVGVAIYLAAILLVMHELAEGIDLADKVGCLVKGKIFEPPADLLADPDELARHLVGG